MSRSEKRGEDCEKAVQRPDRRRDVAVVNGAALQPPCTLAMAAD